MQLLHIAKGKKKELNSSGLTAGAHELQLLPPCFFFRPSFVKHILIQSLTFQIVSAALGGREKKTAALINSLLPPVRQR